MKLWGWVRRLFGGRRAPDPVAPSREREPMHHLAEGATAPRCGAKRFRRWTVILGDATCPECVERGARARVERLLSVR